MPKRVLVVLAGCGHQDGSEIHEAVITLLALCRNGCSVQCAAPDKPQHHVIDHLRREPTGETRNVLVEAARIARGDIVALGSVDAADYDGIFLPGGYGAAKNLSDVAFSGAAAHADPELERVLRAFRVANKPIGGVCIAPAILVAALREGEVTLGAEAGPIEGLGGVHVACTVTEMHVDRARKIVTAPAYMYDATIADVATGIERAVAAFAELL